VNRLQIAFEGSFITSLFGGTKELSEAATADMQRKIGHEIQFGRRLSSLQKTTQQMPPIAEIAFINSRLPNSRLD
jgi:hypothetical protein